MGEVFLEFRNSPVVLMTEVRSTIILLGMQSFRTHGLFDRYAELLTPELREKIFGLVAGVWVPVDLAPAHYRAADELNIDPETINAIGAEIADRTYKSVFAPIAAQAKRKKLTPWEALALAHQNSDLSHRGGDIRIVKEAPRQALFEWAGQPCASVGYYVRSYGAVLRATVNLFCLKVAHSVVPLRTSATTICIRLAWTDDESQGLPVASSAAPLERSPKRA